MLEEAPQSTNEFVEGELDARANALGDVFDADVLAFIGGLFYGTDDIIQNTIERMRKRNSPKDNLVVVLTTLGGFIEVVHRIVDTMRYHYKCVDFVVPNYAFSAGTVLVMSGDAIYMNYYSRLGPIDPQVEGQNNRTVPALGYLVQWERLLDKARDGNLTTAEAHLMIDGFDQAELYQFEQARQLSITLLKQWLVKYKFKDWTKTESRGKRVTKNMKTRRAAAIAKILNNTARWHSHGHGISMEVLKNDLKMRIDDFDQDPVMGNAVRAYYSLLDDYASRRGHSGIIHATGDYQGFR